MISQDETSLASEGFQSIICPSSTACLIHVSLCSVLVRHGILLPRDVGKNKSWWFGIPGISPFVKSLIKGRSAVQLMMKRSKFNEVLESELESRKLSVSKLGMKYHIHDLVGSDYLERSVLSL